MMAKKMTAKKRRSRKEALTGPRTPSNARCRQARPDGAPADEADQKPLGQERTAPRH
jgi:hypothetical protein